MPAALLVGPPHVGAPEVPVGKPTHHKGAIPPAHPTPPPPMHPTPALVPVYPTPLLSLAHPRPRKTRVVPPVHALLLQLLHVRLRLPLQRVHSLPQLPLCVRPRQPQLP